MDFFAGLTCRSRTLIHDFRPAAAQSRRKARGPIRDGAVPRTPSGIRAQRQDDHRRADRRRHAAGCDLEAALAGDFRFIELALRYTEPPPETATAETEADLDPEIARRIYEATNDGRDPIFDEPGPPAPQPPPDGPA